MVITELGFCGVFNLILKVSGQVDNVIINQLIYLPSGFDLPRCAHAYAQAAFVIYHIMEILKGQKFPDFHGF